MNFILFILVYPIILLISILPIEVLHFFSDINYFIVYYIIGYRKKVVRENLKLAFPDKTKAELLIIEKKSFRNFVDVFMEMIKSYTISEKEISRRMVFKNPEIMNDLFKQSKSVILLGGHFANWEWASLYINRAIDYQYYGAYKIVKNKWFDKKIRRQRQRFGARLMQTSKFVRIFNQHKNENHLALYGLLIDQSPKRKNIKYWGSFMGVKVPIQNGAEILAKKYHLPILFLKVKKTARSFYEVTIEELALEPKKLKNFQITDMFIRKLEKMIRENPELYLWTHRRFKHITKSTKTP